MAIKTAYHTQEFRGYRNRLTEPIICVRGDAWLGDAYYFWLDKMDAERWGDKAKRATGTYDIYTSDIECENVLDTVFNEEHYYFWLNAIEQVAKKIIKDTRRKPTIKALNNYLKEKATWSEVDGILFQDLPSSDYYSLIEPLRNDNKTIYFAYKKRIQLALFNTNVIRTFAHFVTKDCVK